MKITEYYNHDLNMNTFRLLHFDLSTCILLTSEEKQQLKISKIPTTAYFKVQRQYDTKISITNLKLIPCG